MKARDCPAITPTKVSERCLQIEIGTDLGALGIDTPAQNTFFRQFLLQSADALSDMHI
jgi:hypothetical protein